MAATKICKSAVWKMFAFPGEKGECFILRIVVDLSGYTLIHCTLIFEMSVLPASNISSKMVQRCRGLTSDLGFIGFLEKLELL